MLIQEGKLASRSIADSPEDAVENFGYQDRGFDSKHRLRYFDGVPVLASGLLTIFIAESQTTAPKPVHWLSNKFSR